MFICSGNICRSPLAHAVFEQMIAENGMNDRIKVESSGTSAYHVGEQADSRMRRTASDHGVRLSHSSRQLMSGDLREYDMLLTMDRNNYRDTQAMCRNDEELAKVRMFRDFDNEGSGDVPDPWYGGMEGFETVWHIVRRTCALILDEVRGQIPV